ncbi:RNB domain-containing ribonuclease, partial [bacterium]|nr:RNB domain-containing ribonuclease [candidate division CSSED10-310 bacterium]
PVPRSDDVFNPYIAYCQRRSMPRAEITLHAKRHFSLGVSAYTNVTSPLRRYFDLIAQRQLRAILGIDEPYTYQELDRLLADLEPAVSRATAISQARNRYWLLKFLATCQGKTLKAQVLDRFPNRFQIWLEELCMDADIPLAFGRNLLPEQHIDVVVESVLPQEDVLKLRLKA